MTLSAPVNTGALYDLRTHFRRFSSSESGTVKNSCTSSALIWTFASSRLPMKPTTGVTSTPVIADTSDQLQRSTPSTCPWVG